MKAYATLSTAAVAGAIWTANGNTFVIAPSAGAAKATLSHAAAEVKPMSSAGLISYGAGFGAIAAVAVSSRRSKKVQMKAKKPTEIANVQFAGADLTKYKIPDYIKALPRSIVKPDVVLEFLRRSPVDKWEDPDEDSYLYTLKAFSEAYGPGKATKMGWWDYYSFKVAMPSNSEDLGDWNYYKADNRGDLLQEEVDVTQIDPEMLAGRMPVFLPGAFGLTLFDTGATINWRGKTEPMAGDTVRTLITDGRFAKNFVDNWAFYREGLAPWQRGLEIGMAHGYFLIGPFTVFGPLRYTPEAATVGLLCGCAIVGLVSVGGLIFGSTIKPTRFDKPGDKPAAGFIEMINWHAVGGLGGAGFAHALLTVFGSS